MVEEFLSRNPICWCAKQNGENIGTAIAWRENGIMHWGRFVVLPPYRGKKIGPKLARYSFEDLFSMGVEGTIDEDLCRCRRLPGGKDCRTTCKKV